MATHRVTFLRQAPFEPGQKLRIEDGPRKGDWEVVAADDKDVALRCPMSGREFTWKRFCTQADERDGVEWPAED
ncbi:hypothetical protein HQ576_00250 [bacterium]|nr:hypothetical protein [bacterium]